MFQQDTGGYPEDLSELSPRYLPIIFGPLTGRGQVWCYQAGENYYRLGYAFYQRYYYQSPLDPFSEVKIYRQVGQPPPGPWMCDQELELIKQIDPQGIRFLDFMSGKERAAKLPSIIEAEWESA